VTLQIRPSDTRLDGPSWTTPWRSQLFMPGWPLFIARYQLFIVSLIACPGAAICMNTAIPPTVAGAQPLSRRSRLLSMVDKNLVADKEPSVLAPVSTNCVGPRALRSSVVKESKVASLQSRRLLLAG
jgi:hypothetical protein